MAENKVTGRGLLARAEALVIKDEDLEGIAGGSSGISMDGSEAAQDISWPSIPGTPDND